MNSSEITFQHITEKSISVSNVKIPDKAALLRVGIVSTVHNAGEDLLHWCYHHFQLGFDHVVLIFDHLEEFEETRLANLLEAQFSPEKLTIWSGKKLLDSEWDGVGETCADQNIVAVAKSGNSPYGIPARQMLNASVVLNAAKKRLLGGVPLDWLLHIDHDELFYLEGNQRGGENLMGHFMALHTAGCRLVRYVNHELLLPIGKNQAPLFKNNPRIAVARLGNQDWKRFSEKLRTSRTAPQHYFSGYTNGKSAVSVSHAQCAAGVHSWKLSRPGSLKDEWFLNGPTILHYRYARSDRFAQKALQLAEVGYPEDARLFPPPRAESTAVRLVEELRQTGASEGEIRNQLLLLHRQLTTFSNEDIQLLTEFGLLHQPKLDFPLMQKHSS